MQATANLSDSGVRESFVQTLDLGCFTHAAAPWCVGGAGLHHPAAVAVVTDEMLRRCQPGWAHDAAAPASPLQADSYVLVELGSEFHLPACLPTPRTLCVHASLTSPDAHKTRAVGLQRDTLVLLSPDATAILGAVRISFVANAPLFASCRFARLSADPAADLYRYREDPSGCRAPSGAVLTDAGVHRQLLAEALSAYHRRAHPAGQGPPFLPAVVDSVWLEHVDSHAPSGSYPEHLAALFLASTECQFLAGSLTSSPRTDSSDSHEEPLQRRSGDCPMLDNM
eukprot:gene18413-28400_t